MALIDPCPRFSPNCTTKCQLPDGVNYDYNIKSPIPYDGPLTKTDTPWPKPVATWTAGEDVTIKFDPSGASHGGGSLALGASYDGGKTSVMVFQRLRYAFHSGPSSSNPPEITEYTFKLPADLPSSDSAVFSLVWYNRLGQREYYRNDLDIKIVGSSSKSYTGPELVIANHAGYPTIPESDDYDIGTGVSLFENAKKITIHADGGSGDAGASEPESQPKSSPAPASPLASAVYEVSSPSPSSSSCTSSTATPPPASSGYSAMNAPQSVAPGTAPASDTSNSSDECTPGELKCNDDQSGFRTCTWGKWGNGFNCGTGTVCKTSEANVVYCGWP
ncbi:hypothetical protein IWW54_000155 [Coemansia sp. RSA 2705]|nr:hypothetical protein IWW54_000155 [Coemansia sp. RSA 2705]